VLVVVPALNEAASLPHQIRELKELRPDLDLLVVDDGSSDGTARLLPTLGVRWLQLPIHLGVGGAVRAGLRYASLHGYGVVIRLDADGQHRPQDIASFLDALADRNVDAVSGSRYLTVRGEYRTPTLRRAPQRALALLLSLVTGRRITDPTSGFWGFGPRALRVLIERHPTGYPEPELHLFLASCGLKVREIPVRMRERLAGRTTLTSLRALMAVGRALLALLVVPLRNPDGESV
jgi:glycosyltransferase involved in cell wall biosynthesis